MKTDFLNDEPIDDEMVALDLLVRRWNDDASREIDLRFIRHDGPYIVIGHHRDFSLSTYRYFRITHRLADVLFLKGLVVGTPEWGYTDNKRLRATEAAEYLLFGKRAELGLTPEHNHFNAEWWFVMNRKESEKPC